LLDRLGLNKEPDQRDALLDGRATWTLAFWFRSSRTAARFSAVAGIGDPAAEDARFIGVLDGRWLSGLGRGAGSAKLLAADSALSNAGWHFATLVGDGENVHSLRPMAGPFSLTQSRRVKSQGRLEMGPLRSRT